MKTGKYIHPVGVSMLHKRGAKKREAGSREVAARSTELIQKVTSC